MANTYEGQDYWHDEISQIKLSDPISGGSSAKTNLPTKELTDRTKWLQTRLAQNDVIYADPDETGAISTGTKKEYYAPFDLILERVNVQVVTQSEQDIIVDVQVDDSSIFVSSSKPNLTAYTNYTETELDTTSVPSSGRDVYEVTKDQKIDFIVDDAGFNGAGLKVILVARRDFG